MTNPLLTALGKLPAFSGISYRCFTEGDQALPVAFVTMDVVPTTLVPSGFSSVAGLRVVIAFLNRTARDASLFAAGGLEVAILPECAFRTMGEVEFPNSLTVRVVEEIVEAGWPEPTWPQDPNALMQQITTALAAPAQPADMARYTGPFALTPATEGWDT